MINEIPHRISAVMIDAYEAYQEKKFEEYEALCRRCGGCCGTLDGDLCEHLVSKDNGYLCDTYETRHGLRKTRSGKTFMCVPIKDVLNKSWHARPGCGYYKNGSI